MDINTYVLDWDRYELLDFPQIEIRKFSSILYSPKTPRVSTDTLRIFRIFSDHIWFLILISYLFLLVLNVFKTSNLSIKSKLCFDYFGILLFKSKNISNNKQYIT